MGAVSSVGKRGRLDTSLRVDRGKQLVQFVQGSFFALKNLLSGDACSLGNLSEGEPSGILAKSESTFDDFALLGSKLTQSFCYCLYLITPDRQ